MEKNVEKRFCRFCGKSISKEDRFCRNCGASMEVDMPTEKVVDTVKTGEKRHQTVSGNRVFGKKQVIVLLTIIIAVVGLGGFLYFSSDAYNCKKSMRLAQKYYAEEKYKEARIYYTAGLKLDKTLIEAYVGIADAYMAEEKYIKAMKTLNNGLEETEDESLIQKWKEVYDAWANADPAAEEETEVLELLGDASDITHANIFINLKTEMMAKEETATCKMEQNGVTMELKLDAVNDIISKWTQTSIISFEGVDEVTLAALDASIEMMKEIYAEYDKVTYDVQKKDNALVEVITIDMTDSATIKSLADADLLPVEGSTDKLSLKLTLENLKSSGWMVE